MSAPTYQSLAMQRRLAAERQSGKLMQASRDERRVGNSLGASKYKSEAQKLIALAHPISGKDKKRSKAAGY
jgi:hypothetical protein